jgi:hypothetical protein
MLSNINPEFSKIFNPVPQSLKVDSIQTGSGVSRKSCYFPQRSNNGKSNLSLNDIVMNEVCSKVSGYQNVDFFAKKLKEYIENVSKELFS